MLKIPLLILSLVLITSQLSAQSAPREQVEADASSAALSELMDQGASIGMRYGTYIGKRPKLPILDKKDGSIHPASCNPHINFTSKELARKKLESLIPHLKKLRPDHGATHVALYLPKKLFDDKALVKQLRKQLPNCQIYFEHHKANSHNVPTNRAAG